MEWKTVSLTALSPGIVVTDIDGNTQHALALMCQQSTDGTQERVKLGILNAAKGTVEPVLHGRLVDIDVSRWWCGEPVEGRRVSV